MGGVAGIYAALGVMDDAAMDNEGQAAASYQ